jgi:hypothetical protein
MICEVHIIDGEHQGFADTPALATTSWVFVTFGDDVLTELVDLKWFIGTVTEKYPSRLTARNTRTFSHPSPKVTKSRHPLLWWGVNSTLFGKYPLDQRPGPPGT